MKLCENRTHNNGELRIENVGEIVELKGWCSKKRNLGSLVFIDIRDKHGITQLVINEKLASVAENIKSEYVIYAKGKVIERVSKNPNMDTGDIEIEVSELEIINDSETPPFVITENPDASESIRLKYRYLDLRRKQMQDILKTRAKTVKSIRSYLDELDFTEVETPILGKATPEGARDYLVPSRIHNGKFFALPQSPQLFKQLLMVSGLERYYQIAKCFRDEDLRADRQPEFTQIDLEMSFASLEIIYSVIEGMFKRIWKDVKGIDNLTFPRLTWHEAMETYGSDKPDIRYEMKLVNIEKVFANSEHEFLKGKCIRAIVCKDCANKFTRKDIDALTENAKKYKAKSLLWFKVNNDLLEGASAKLVNEKEKEELKELLHFENNDLVIFVADEKWLTTVTSLGATRIAVAKKLGLDDHDKYAFLWVTEFPMYEYSDDGKLQAMHHPFTAYNIEDEKYLDSDPTRVRSDAYDIVLNGYELGSGSRRIYNQKMQKEVFDRLGLTKDDIERKFGFFVEALSYGTPPHLGMGLGIERIVMILVGSDNIRDVVAFPKIQSTIDLMNECPSRVAKEDLDILGIEIKEE